MSSLLVQEIAALEALESSVSSSKSPEETLQALVDAIVRLTSADRGSLILVDWEQKAVSRFVRGGHGWTDVMTTVGFDELSSGLTGWALTTGEIVVSPKEGDDPRETEDVRRRRRETHCGSILVAPLGDDSNRWGTLTLINRPDQPDFGPTDADTIRLFVPFLAQSVRLAAAQDEVARARTEASAAVKSKLNFLSNLSHELRTPLNGILGFSHLLASSQLDSSQADMVSTILTSGQRLLDTVDNILELAQFEAGQVRLEAHPFSPRAALESTAQRFRPLAVEKGLGWQVSVESSVPPVVVGDAVRLTQAWGHLLSNALKFTSAGSVSMRLEGRMLDGGRWRLVLHVEDTGIGMAGERSGRWFSPFHQEDGSLTRKFGGTGLGLTLCDRLVRSMNGSLSLQGVPGVGTKALAAVELGVEGSELHRSAPVLRVLLQHGEEQAGVELVRQIEKADHRVDVATSVALACERLALSTYEAVLVSVPVEPQEFEQLVALTAKRGTHLVALGHLADSAAQGTQWTARLPTPPSTQDLLGALQKCQFRKTG
jgi:signal transduction histidine kinase